MLKDTSVAMDENLNIIFLVTGFFSMAPTDISFHLCTELLILVNASVNWMSSNCPKMFSTKCLMGMTLF